MWCRAAVSAAKAAVCGPTRACAALRRAARPHLGATGLSALHSSAAVGRRGGGSGERGVVGALGVGGGGGRSGRGGARRAVGRVDRQTDLMLAADIQRCVAARGTASSSPGLVVVFSHSANSRPWSQFASALRSSCTSEHSHRTREDRRAADSRAPQPASQLSTEPAKTRVYSSPSLDSFASH